MRHDDVLLSSPSNTILTTTTVHNDLKKKTWWKKQTRTWFANAYRSIWCRGAWTCYVGYSRRCCWSRYIYTKTCSYYHLEKYVICWWYRHCFVQGKFEYQYIFANFLDRSREPSCIDSKIISYDWFVALRFIRHKQNNVPLSIYL